MSEIEDLLQAYEDFVRLPWDHSLAGAEKVWFVIYDPAQERRLRLRLPKFEVATKDAGHGWIQLDLAAVMDKPPSVVNDIINGRRPITPEIAKTLGEIFDNGAQVWLNLQTAYQLAMSSDTDNLLARRRKLYERAPIREMQKRHWIEESNNVKVNFNARPSSGIALK